MSLPYLSSGGFFMGADMLVACFFEPFDKDFKPDWGRASKYLEEQIAMWIKKDKVPSGIDYLGEPEEAADAIRSHLKEVKDAYEGGHRELTTLEFPPYRVYLTGGMSYGDSPSEIFNSINNLNELNLLDKAGFNEVPNYQGMVTSMLAVKSTLPLFMGLSTDLDELISKRLKPRRKK
jgi:hypothetical protein